MLQRIQTVYLLIITFLGGLACYFQIDFFLPYYKEIKTFLIPIFTVALGLIPVVAFIAIFLFKKRKLQIMLIWVAVFFILIYYLVTFYIRIDLQIGLKEIFSNFSVILNFINLLLCNLAINAIKKDENLVRAADRIR